MPSGIYEHKPLTPEHKANIAAALTGELNPNWGRDSGGELSSAWKGDIVGYNTAHYRARKALAGRTCAQEDETCSGRLEVAFNNDTPAEFIKNDPATDSLFSTRSEDYLRLCTSHHRRYDREE